MSYQPMPPRSSTPKSTSTPGCWMGQLAVEPLRGAIYQGQLLEAVWTADFRRSIPGIWRGCERVTGKVLPWGPRGALFLMSEVTRYPCVGGRKGTSTVDALGPSSSFRTCQSQLPVRAIAFRRSIPGIWRGCQRSKDGSYLRLIDFGVGGARGPRLSTRRAPPAASEPAGPNAGDLCHY